MSRGFFGIGIENGKTVENVGTLWRTAHALGAAFIFTVGHRYRHQPSDTSAASRSIPLFQYDNLPQLLSALPEHSKLVGVEWPHPKSRALPSFTHPERAVYLLGAEDKGLSQGALTACSQIVHIPAAYCLNVAVAGSLVMYDRMAKTGNAA